MPPIINWRNLPHPHTQPCYRRSRTRLCSGISLVLGVNGSVGKRGAVCRAIRSQYKVGRSPYLATQHTCKCDRGLSHISSNNMLYLVLALSVPGYLIALTCYNLFFHPLRSFPGPPLAKVSRLWSRIGNRTGRKSDRIHEAHLKYGPVVRIGPNELSFAEPAAARAIYTSDALVKEETFYVRPLGNSIYACKRSLI